MIITDRRGAYMWSGDWDGIRLDRVIARPTPGRSAADGRRDRLFGRQVVRAVANDVMNMFTT
jgi:hypothetical protein